LMETPARLATSRKVTRTSSENFAVLFDNVVKQVIMR
jgi:hypothetical protein